MAPTRLLLGCLPVPVDPCPLRPQPWLLQPLSLWLGRPDLGKCKLARVRSDLPSASVLMAGHLWLTGETFPRDGALGRLATPEHGPQAPLTTEQSPPAKQQQQPRPQHGA